MARGKLILIEGLDRTGKSTQTEKLVKSLGDNALLVKFPERSTQIGGLIDQYLTNPEFLLPDQAIHLLFSANRWEIAESMKRSLLKGQHVVMDRYVYSGVAYSAAKDTKGMDLNWCLQPDKGLLKPDLTLFLTNSDSELRQGFGEERYECTDFQDKVRGQFAAIFDTLEDPDYKSKHIKFLDTTHKTIEEVHQLVRAVTSDYIQGHADVNEFIYF
ncbi:LANO_0F15236g1_1 [Lachancea nothofagi CBS 11611]|uniref:Thymidylate kinase n=1 Tax=Lachancea nothofagi CBS 11611 TaxID=1266666 RepID=A0A1G4KCH9_9SACH|nr:LANO_0F15236g1_1 [Lachancea nothofagi CBS 11611]